LDCVGYCYRHAHASRLEALQELAAVDGRPVDELLAIYIGEVRISTAMGATCMLAAPAVADIAETSTPDKNADRLCFCFLQREKKRNQAAAGLIPVQGPGWFHCFRKLQHIWWQDLQSYASATAVRGSEY